jgi:hypothetical protein
MAERAAFEKAQGFQPFLRNLGGWGRVPGNELPGYSQASLRDDGGVKRWLRVES